MTTTNENCTPATRITRSLLGYGIIAGPIYVIVSLAMALTRPGFDLTRHAWSLLENGNLGWVQITNFVVTGLMTVAAAVGLRRALAVPDHSGRRRGRAAPVLVAIYGASLIAAGIFRADPAEGFPIGTPADAPVSWHGMLHLAAGSVGFGCLIAACFVLAVRFAAGGQRGLAWFSRVTGVLFLAGFAGIASGSHGPTTLTFAGSVVVVWTWLSTASVHLYRTTGQTPAGQTPAGQTAPLARTAAPASARPAA